MFSSYVRGSLELHTKVVDHIEVFSICAGKFGNTDDWRTKCGGILHMCVEVWLHECSQIISFEKLPLILQSDTLQVKYIDIVKRPD